MNWVFSLNWILITAVWYFGNGMLHSISVLVQHKGNYDRELLRLLMDGHVLMLSGAIIFVCWLMMLSKIQCGGLIAIVVGSFMLLYCAMIFPFLKSYGTIAISIMLIIVSWKAMNGFPNIYNIMQNYK